MRYMMYMDTKRVAKFLAVVLFLSTCLQACGMYASKDVTERTIPDVVSDEDTEIIWDDSEDTDSSEDEVYIINNSVEEILSKVENAENGDRVGCIDNQDIYVFRCPELTTRPVLYSKSGILVRYDDYVCVRYEPEKSNEEYILLVYYFDTNNKWESWYKYIIANNNDEAEKIASQERDNGYTVWISENIVMEGELFSEASITEKEFLVSFENEKVYLNK